MVTRYFFGTAVSFAALLVEFAVCTAVVLFLSTRLSRYADALERATSASAIWIGAILLAIVTSLPEAVVTIGAAVMENTLDLGVANLCGSNTFNLLIVVILDAFNRGAVLALQVRRRLLLAAGSGIAMMSLVAGALLVLSRGAEPGWRWAGGAASVIIFGAYLLLNWLSTTRGVGDLVSHPAGAVARKTATAYTLPTILVRLAAYSVLLVLAALWLLRVCDALAVTPVRVLQHRIVLGQTVTGTFLLSAATSFPELFVCLSVFRLGQKNMALANLLGSNMVNMSLIPLMHLFVWDAGFYLRLDASSVLVLLAVAILMTLLFMAGVLARVSRSFLGLGWETWGMLLVYVTGAVVVLRMGLSL